MAHMPVEGERHGRSRTTGRSIRRQAGRQVERDRWRICGQTRRAGADFRLIARLCPKRSATSAAVARPWAIFFVGRDFSLAIDLRSKTIYSKSFYGSESLAAMVEKINSIHDVARMAGVSPATVSNVLTGRKRVSAKLVKRVEAAVKALDYRADPRASMLRSGEAKIIAVVVPDLDNAFFTSVVSAVEQCLGPEPYEVIVASSHGEEEVEKSRLKAILAWRPAGLIVIPCTDAFPGRALIESSETPYVVADRGTGNLSADTVSVDNEGAGAIGARHLIDLGHKDLLITASSLSLANIRQRCGGGAEAMRSHGLPEPAIVELGFSIDEASARLSKWFDENPPPTAILALTNFTTLSALTTLAERNLRMPRDMSLIGFRPARARYGPGSLGYPEREDRRRPFAGETCPVVVRNQGSRVDRPCPRCASRNTSHARSDPATCRNSCPLTTNNTEFWVAV
jgi:LacI family transcriptional regulator